MFCGKIDSLSVDPIWETIITETSTSIFIAFPERPSWKWHKISDFVPMTTINEIHTIIDFGVMAGISKTLIYPLGQEIVNTKRK